MRIETTEKERNLRNLTAVLVGMGVVGVRESDKPKLLADGGGELKPRFIAPTDGHFFNINKNSDEETAKVVLEELKTEDLTKRVTNSKLGRTVNGVPEMQFSEYNVHAEAEWLATHNAFKLGKECNFMFWLSAEDGAMGLSPEEAKEKGFVYGDGRCNIYFVTKEDREVVISGKHMPLNIDRFKTLELGKRLVGFGGKTLGKMETVEELRVQPIGFNLENPEEWIAECRKMMPEFEKFWQMFENGDDLKQEAEMIEVVKEVKKIAKGNNYIFQKEMGRRGYVMNMLTNHGIGYAESQYGGVYSFKMKIVNGEVVVEAKRVNGKLVCPICGVEIGEGVTICPKCKIKISGTKIDLN